MEDLPLTLLCQRDFSDVALPCPFPALPASLPFFCPLPVTSPSKALTSIPHVSLTDTLCQEAPPEVSFAHCCLPWRTVFSDTQLVLNRWQRENRGRLGGEPEGADRVKAVGLRRERL